MGKIIDLLNNLISSMSILGRITVATNGASLDLQGYNGNILAILTSEAGGGTSPTLDVKIQDSADNSSFADVSGSVFAQIVGTESHQEISVDPRAVRRYVRMVATITGTSPVFDCAGLFIGGKQTI